MADHDYDHTHLEELGVEPRQGSSPIEIRRSTQMGMFAALFAAQPETWPLFLAWLDKHAPATARMMRANDVTPLAFEGAADILAGLDLGLHMLGIHETGHA